VSRAQGPPHQQVDIVAHRLHRGVHPGGIDHPIVVASRGDGREGSHGGAVTLLAGVVVDVVLPAVPRQRHSGVRRKRGGEARVVDAAVGPFGVAGVGVGFGAELGRATSRQPGDRGGIGRRIVGRIRPSRIGAVPHVGRVGLHLGGAERLAHPVGNLPGLQVGVGEEDAVAARSRGRVIDEPGAKVEAVVERVAERAAALGANPIVGLARAEEDRDPALRHAADGIAASVEGLLQIHPHRRRSLLDEGQDAAADAPGAVVVGKRGARRVDHARRQPPLGALIDQRGQGELPQVRRAAHPPGRLAGPLHGRQEQADQGGDDRDHDQELDQGKPAAARALVQPAAHFGVQPDQASLQRPEARVIWIDLRVAPGVVAVLARDASELENVVF